jgi:hypothetical protein
MGLAQHAMDTSMCATGKLVRPRRTSPIERRSQMRSTQLESLNCLLYEAFWRLALCIRVYCAT